MAETINLNKARKRKARAEKERRAEANRVRYGRTAAQRLEDVREETAARRRHEQHRRDEPSATSQPPRSDRNELEDHELP